MRAAQCLQKRKGEDAMDMVVSHLIGVGMGRRGEQRDRGNRIGLIAEIGIEPIGKRGGTNQTDRGFGSRHAHSTFTGVENHQLTAFYGLQFLEKLFGNLQFNVIVVIGFGGHKEHVFPAVTMVGEDQEIFFFNDIRQCVQQ